MEKSRIRELLAEAIAEANEQRSEGHRLSGEPETILFGQSEGLDSLGFVNLIVNLEQRIELETGILIPLANEQLVAGSVNANLSVQYMTDHISRLLAEASS